MKLRQLLIMMATGLVTFILLIVVYAAQVRSSAQTLIDSAKAIRNTSDAKREIAAWRHHYGWNYSEEVLPEGNSSFNVHIENGLLHSLHLVPPTVLGATLTLRNGELRSLLVVMFSGRTPNKTSGVWVQEWFGLAGAGNFHVNDKDRPWKATVDFTSTTSEKVREKAFSANTKCFVHFDGCSSAEEILPGVWQLPTTSDRQRTQ